MCPSGQLVLGPCVPKTIGLRTTSPLGQLIIARSSCPLLDASRGQLLPLLLDTSLPLSIGIIHDRKETRGVTQTFDPRPTCLSDISSRGTAHPLAPILCPYLDIGMHLFR